jgi:hypothetical protein
MHSCGIGNCLRIVPGDGRIRMPYRKRHGNPLPPDKPEKLNFESPWPIRAGIIMATLALTGMIIALVILY